MILGDATWYFRVRARNHEAVGSNPTGQAPFETYRYCRVTRESPEQMWLGGSRWYSMIENLGPAAILIPVAAGQAGMSPDQIQP